MIEPERTIAVEDILAVVPMSPHDFEGEKWEAVAKASRKNFWFGYACGIVTPLLVAAGFWFGWTHP